MRVAFLPDSKVIARADVGTSVPGFLLPPLRGWSLDGRDESVEGSSLGEMFLMGSTLRSAAWRSILSRNVSGHPARN